MMHGIEEKVASFVTANRLNELQLVASSETKITGFIITTTCITLCVYVMLLLTRQFVKQITHPASR